MSHGHTKIASKGFCIYCMNSNLTLTDEHIVPFSLGGQHVILKASCLNCADITKKFEQDIARELWGDARISYNALSRRKKQKETHIKLPLPHRTATSLKIPYNEYPAAFIFYKMHPAGYLQGLAEQTDISGAWQLTAITDEFKKNEFLLKYPNQLTIKFRHVPNSFGRLLAKIGYGNALCTLNPTDFNPICVPYILGHKKNISYIVGSNFDCTPPTIGIGYKLSTGGIDRKSVV